MYCISCDTKMKCIETRTSLKDYTTYRRYKCYKCQTLTYTEEYPMMDEEAKGKIYRIKNNLE